jgi:hypothetical protein
MGIRGTCIKMVEKPEGMRPLGRPRCMWVANIIIDLKEIGCGRMGWIDVSEANAFLPQPNSSGDVTCTSLIERRGPLSLVNGWLTQMSELD